MVDDYRGFFNVKKEGYFIRDLYREQLIEAVCEGCNDVRTCSLCL